ncbi:bis(5'-nucleosyl)-tetraphosphatase PrpE [asymmetrical]-like [Panonychus citri]|uniref:bis(5'-nucleosyl)-tetraphosphatase PrpE [asymmetrical]-like n=1 Tax=Panonychus citri TaxID=50023 RepID=UPI0023079590|nr:bis(5'-nucleosyl)-tetraphosphatase PrpE [asymmetrical]-like [Panonychus citri]XP_053210737.1 bis(5'-nucleosyl)-tetraphosphatase PrpE [asymmetrical]-like [Panonychus citri]
MSGMLFNLFYLVRSRFFSTGQISKSIHPWDIPLPPVLHRTLEKSFTDNYDEILILGDIHGCFDEMFECIQSAHRDNNSKILKIFVGDLVNKGEKHLQVLEYLMSDEAKDCICIRGNHDEKVIREYLKLQKESKTSQPVYEWIKNLNEQQLNFLINLPYTLTLPALNITIVHAGLIPGLPLEDNQPFDMVNMRNLIKDDSSNSYIPVRQGKEGEPWASLWNGPNHVYFGHDAKRGHQLHRLATGLDTGCVYGKQLTAIFVQGPRKGTYITINAKKVYQPITGAND